ncbi:hypothetical protein EVAR_40892_1 [Eumeta japonica]|uniref:Uncharacterized protein n=1 Tax=Eumeta variegata TaxID=151549 RepID=A0A4C1X4F3_EUMVA|nr:hypothetical protein EVAR_40892_1 [Eumeta japonica]
MYLYGNGFVSLRPVFGAYRSRGLSEHAHDADARARQITLEDSVLRLLCERPYRAATRLGEQRCWRSCAGIGYGIRWNAIIHD